MSLVISATQKNVSCFLSFSVPLLYSSETNIFMFIYFIQWIWDRQNMCAIWVRCKLSLHLNALIWLHYLPCLDSWKAQWLLKKFCKFLQIHILWTTTGLIHNCFSINLRIVLFSRLICSSANDIKPQKIMSQHKKKKVLIIL